jgi:hypothetical protein
VGHPQNLRQAKADPSLDFVARQPQWRGAKSLGMTTGVRAGLRNDAVQTHTQQRRVGHPQNLRQEFGDRANVGSKTCK